MRYVQILFARTFRARGDWISLVNASLDEAEKTNEEERPDARRLSEGNQES
jgi:hypothetical protein